MFSNPAFGPLTVSHPLFLEMKGRIESAHHDAPQSHAQNPTEQLVKEEVKRRESRFLSLFRRVLLTKQAQPTAHRSKSVTIPSFI